MYRNVSDENIYFEGDEFKPGEALSEAAVQDKDWLGVEMASGRVMKDEQ